MIEEVANPASVGDDAHHIHADSSLTGERIRVLKHGDTFALFDQYGDLRASHNSEHGLYCDGTRFLSRLTLKLEGDRPFFLSSTVRDDNDQLTVALTNPDLCRDGAVVLPLGTLHISVRRFLWQRCLHQEVRVENHGMQPVSVVLAIELGADFADIYEVRGLKRKSRGADLEPGVASDGVELRYRGLDALLRRTILRFSPAPDGLCADRATFHVVLDHKASSTFCLAVSCEQGTGQNAVPSFHEARCHAAADLDDGKARTCRIDSLNGQFKAMVNRAASDLHMMITALPTGRYPYAGVPWFNTPFGRDGIITALECLWFDPGMARGVLAYLASTQATEVIRAEDAEPGKILHETRNGEMAALGEMPFARYYGSVDATPLYVVLAGAYFERTADLEFVRSIWPNIEAALLWIDWYGDRDGDGFIEYERQSPDGLIHQGWKDSDNAVFHSDGSPARGPIALCEVQAYTYAAWRAAAMIAAALGYTAGAEEFGIRADALRVRFDSAFWCDELSTYGLALDGGKRLCRVRTSNAGQCLFSGIAAPNRASRVAKTLLSPESFSGWGLRTVAACESRYNPMGYHTGSVWPHDNALIGWGLARYGLSEGVVQIFTGLFEASGYFDLHRIPELFCGFARDPGEGPVLYPVACAPQAWAAGAVLLLLQACLGLTLNAGKRTISFIRPVLPGFLSEVKILDLRLPDASADLLLTRHNQGVGLQVLRRSGEVEITVVR
jgi:glycogen debranching enzyme